jgi:glutamine synthetase
MIMKDQNISLNPNLLVRYLKKPAHEFTMDDLIKFIEDHDIEMLNLRYIAEDGKLKSLNFVINSKEHLIALLSTGERVDGSSLFSYIGAGSSDLYVIPRYKTAFINPFAEVPTLDILCSFYNSDGYPLANAPENILKKAHNDFKKATGYKLKALGELEYYVKSEPDTLYPALDQKGYHESPPFTNWDGLRKEAIKMIAECGGVIKYGHSEVGNFTTEHDSFEQHEIEFLPCEVEDAADQLIIAKWILRMLGERYGVVISFAPKITVGKAGSGMHFHMLVEKDGKNLMTDEKGLSDVAKKVIAGLLTLAKPITAFGNTIPTSYLRLVPHQEAPTNICWGDRNRSVLVRVPLGWWAKTSMIKDANPQQEEVPYIEGKQTVELRSPDGSADIYLTLAAITIASKLGLTSKDSLKIAEKLYVDVNIFKPEHEEKLNSLEYLPASCWESAEALDEYRKYFEENDIFPAGTIDSTIEKLKAFNDKDLSERLYGLDDVIRRLVEEHVHCM